MSATLARKELREAAPFLALALLFVVVEVTVDMLGQGFFASSLQARFDELFARNAVIAGFTFALALFVGGGLFTREQDDGTLDFLCALPISPARIFLVKLAVAWAAVLSFPLTAIAVVLVPTYLARGTLEAPLPAHVLPLGLLGYALMTFCALTLAASLSFLRQLRWLVLALAAAGLATLRRYVPGLDSLQPLALAELRIDGGHWHLRADALRVQLPLALAAAGLSLALFTGLAGRALEGLRKRLAGPVLGAFVTGLSAVALVGAVAAIAMSDRDDADEPSGSAGVVAAPTSTLARATTKHYEFTYPDHMRHRAQLLLREGDAVFERVAKVLEVAPGERVRASLTGSTRHTLGTAKEEMLRMDLTSASDELLLAVLAHETTHVLLARERDPNLWERWQPFALLDEGYATYVERVLFPEEQESPVKALLVAATWSRRTLTADLLLDPAALERALDRELFYPFGERLTRTLIRLYGEDAVRRISRATSNPDAPDHLAPFARWQDVLQSEGMDLAHVLSELQLELRALVEKEKLALAELPRPRATFERGEDGIGIRAAVDKPLPAGWSVVVRFRPREDADLSELEGPYTLDDVLWREEGEIANGVVWFQLGLASPGGGNLYERWSSYEVQ